MGAFVKTADPGLFAAGTSPITAPHRVPFPPEKINSTSQRHRIEALTAARGVFVADLHDAEIIGTRLENEWDTEILNRGGFGFAMELQAFSTDVSIGLNKLAALSREYSDYHRFHDLVGRCYCALHARRATSATRANAPVSTDIK